MRQVQLMADYDRNLSRYDQDVAGARMSANQTSLIYAVATLTSLANRIEADAPSARLAQWERNDLEIQAAKLEEAVALIRNAAMQGLVRQLQAAE